MNITSVSGQDLYRILFGRDVGTKVNVKDDIPESRNPDGTVRRFDRLDVSDTYKIDPDTSSVISLFETGDEAYSALMRFRGFTSDKDFAKHFADIGKRLDTAYAEGKFTEEEYNELNTGLGEYISHMKEKNDVWRAKRELLNDSSFSPVNIMTGDTEKDKKMMDDFGLEKKKAIDSILNRKGFRTPIEKMMEMINNFRYANASNLNGINYGI